MKKIYRIIFLMVLIFHTGKVCAEDTIPQVVNPNEYLKLAQESNFAGIAFQPEDLYYIDTNLAFQLAELELDFLLKNSKALKVLGDTTEYNEMLKLLDTDIISIDNDSLYCISYVRSFGGDIIDLEHACNRLNEVMATDSILKSTLDIRWTEAI